MMSCSTTCCQYRKTTTSDRRAEDVDVPEAASVRVTDDVLHLGKVRVAFQRTLRLPESARTHRLPPGFGRLPVAAVADLSGDLPEQVRARGGVVVAMSERAAMWLRLSSPRRAAVQVGVGKVCAVSGTPWSDELSAEEQNYVVVPRQRWLDGIKHSDGKVRQFVATQLGRGATVEGQVTGSEDVGGMQLRAVPSKCGCVPSRPSVVVTGSGGWGPTWSHPVGGSAALSAGGSASVVINSASGASMSGGAPMSRAAAAPASSGSAGGAVKSMGVAAGGEIRQKVYTDDHSPGAYDTALAGRCFVHLVDPATFSRWTGRDVPAHKIRLGDYLRFGVDPRPMRWFDVTDADLADVEASGTLSDVQPLEQFDDPDGHVEDGEW